MAKKKYHQPAQVSLFDVEAKVETKQVAATTKQKNEIYTPYVDTFKHMEYGINKAYLAGESIIKNRGNSI